MAGSLLLLACMNAPAAASSARLALLVARGRGAAEFAGLTGVFFFAQVVCLSALLGTFGLLAPVPLAGAALAVCASVFFLAPLVDGESGVCRAALSRIWSQSIPTDTAADRLVVAGLAFGLPVLALAMAMGLRAWPPPYDALTYHLHFPARWLQEGAVFVVPTPFGDPAPAYAPSNAEMWFAWLMAPLDSDILARVGPFPLLLLALVCIFGIGRRLGLPRGASLACAGLFAADPLALRQGVTAEVDLAMAAFLLAAVWLLLVYREQPDARTAIAAGAAAGLFLGTKYVAAAYFPALAVGAALVLLRPDPARGKPPWKVFGHVAAWVLFVLACGGFWYVRNAISFGSPLFPAGIWIGGHAVFDGPVTRAAMMRSEFHIPEARWLPVVAAHATDTRWFFPLLALWLTGTAIAIRQRHAPRLAVNTLAATSVLLWIFALPYNSQYRFLLPAVALAWIGAGPVFAARGWLRRAGVAVALAAAGWVLFAQIPGLALGELRFPETSLIHPHALGLVFGAFAFCCAVFFFAARAGRLRVGLVALVFVLLAACAAALPARWVDPPSGRPLRLGLVPPRSLPLVEWAWVGENLHGTTIAYAGANTPYPLAGPERSNRAVYVNVDGRTGWHLADYFRERLERAERPEPSDKPAFYRDGADYGRWREALAREGVTHLWVEPLGPNEMHRMPHDAEGFPVERMWATEHPGDFAPLLITKRAELYRVVSPSP